jgi:hypothetical protein
MLASGEAVRAGSKEEQQMMVELWEKVAKKFTYIASAGKWTYRDKGTDKGLLADCAAQRTIDAEFRTALPVLSYGRKDEQVRMTYKTPQLPDVTNPWLEASFEQYRKGRRQELPLAKMLIADFWDTYPSKPRIVELEDGSRAFNLWSAPTVKATRSENYHEPRWFLDVVDRFFGKHGTEREYFLDWCAHLVCHPEVKMPVSVLLTSGLTGAGKNFIADALKWMVGERNTKSVTSDSLKGGFHSFIPGTSLVVISELYEGGNYGFADKLKTLQSEDTLLVNLKYGPQENVRNRTHFLVFSNNAVPINLDENDRRWFTFASPQREAMPADWWADKWRFLKNPRGGLLRIPTKPATHSNRKPATYSDLKPASVPI